tara:strand:- start:1877 stop:2530 length:654 start_codon:yes stop_codon:yes gene_type:complete
MSSFSFTEENYIKNIYLLGKSSPRVSTNAISKELNTKPASVTDMLRKLADKNILIYEKYKGVKLKPLGESIAIKTIRKQRLWEYFLVEKLEFGWDEVQELAEQLEHIQSPKLTDSLDAFLGFPNYDPHGDPIPNKAGVFPSSLGKTLDAFKAGDKVRVSAVKDSSPEFLRYLEKLKIELNTTLEIQEVEDFDKTMTVKIKGETRSLSQISCENIYAQ